MRILEPFQRFAGSEAASGIVLLASTACALVWANSPWQPAYVSLLHHSLPIGSGSLRLDLTVRQWINDCLMALFFLLVGLEIKREMLAASSHRCERPLFRSLPPWVGWSFRPSSTPRSTAAASAREGGEFRWPPTSPSRLASPRCSVRAFRSRSRSFLAAVAIVDDIGAVLVIAIFYTASIAWASLAVVAALVIVLALLNRAGVQRPAPYLAPGNRALGGRAVVRHPCHDRRRAARAHDSRERAERRELAAREARARAQHPDRVCRRPTLRARECRRANRWRGVEWSVAHGARGCRSVGLVLGKPLGISLAAWLAVRMRFAALPDSVSWRMLRGVSWLGGIGFTMSLFVGALAFTDEALLDSAKIGVLLASCVAAFMGWLDAARAAAPGSE